MSTADSAILASHEERIQQGELFRAEVAANMAALTEQLKQVGEKVDGVGEALKERITELKHVNEHNHESLRREVADLKRKTDDHGAKLALLLTDRETSAARVKMFKKAGVGALLTVLGAIATRWGEAIYTWLSGK